MTLRVSGKNLAIGEALRTHVHSRIDGVVAKYRAGSPTGHVTIEPEGSGYRADCTLFLKSGITLQVEAIAHEPYASFDKAADRIERRLRDHRKRLTGRHSEGGSDAETSTTGSDMDDLDINASDLDAAAASDETAPGEKTFPAIVAEHGSGLRELTVAAAAQALDEEGCPFVIFRYAENRRINIVYRRPDGNIGWIDPTGGERDKSA